jgi:catechol 2,3-dioxygenase-like lactoylglutathione lyase family enzyme
VLNDAELVAFVATSDLARSREFYEGVLGLAIVEESPFACVVDAHGTMLRITPVAERAEADYTVLGWVIPDIEAAVRELAAAGVTFRRFDGMGQDALGVWNAPGGDRVAWFTDPDGNTLSLTQLR